MKINRNLVVRILLVSLAVILVAYFMVTRQNEKHYQWFENYSSTSNQPYGTMFIQKMLATYRPGQNFIFNDNTPIHKLLDSARLKTKTDYVFIGRDFYLDDDDKKKLLEFIASGNDAFLATVDFPFTIVDEVYENECDKEIYFVEKDTLTATLNFYDSSLRSESGYTYAYRFGKTDLPYYWNIVAPEIFCEANKSIAAIGYAHLGKANFLKFVYGKGNLYVHANPLVFTNYFMTKADKVEYASRVFSHLQGQTMVWDEFSKSPFIGNNAPKVNPMAYILQQESLRYAWWMMLVAVLLYTFFTAKRKQRLIPVLEPKANTSLEFIHVISALHFQNGVHRDVARKRMKYFYYFIKAKYGLHLQVLTETHVTRLAEKSRIELEHLNAVAIQFNHIEKDPYYDQSRLVDLQIVLEKFYNTVNKNASEI